MQSDEVFNHNFHKTLIHGAYGELNFYRVLPFRTVILCNTGSEQFLTSAIKLLWGR
jgi:hypothetical protein